MRFFLNFQACRLCSENGDTAYRFGIVGIYPLTFFILGLEHDKSMNEN
jgi:hypothetical protein